MKKYLILSFLTLSTINASSIVLKDKIEAIDKLPKKLTHNKYFKNIKLSSELTKEELPFSFSDHENKINTFLRRTKNQINDLENKINSNKETYLNNLLKHKKALLEDFTELKYFLKTKNLNTKLNRYLNDFNYAKEITLATNKYNKDLEHTTREINTIKKKDFFLPEDLDKVNKLKALKINLLKASKKLAFLNNNFKLEKNKLKSDFYKKLKKLKYKNYNSNLKLNNYHSFNIERVISKYEVK